MEGAGVGVGRGGQQRDSGRGPAVRINAAESVWAEGGEGGQVTGEGACRQPGSILMPAEQRR